MIEDIITKLEGIWTYAALDLHHKVPQMGYTSDIQEANEYALTLIKLWDYLDTQDMDTIERAIVELDGRIMIEDKSIDKIMRTQLLDYINSITS